ncbi:MAG: GspH/FimT family pseudopilin [Gammaproteobacteria bacterium]|nr:GspH/FimT family pseudopilin [Gammaproteobacteria bacterium]
MHSNQLKKIHVFSRKNGFTLIELLVSIVILSIIAALAVPSYQDIVLRNRMSAEMNSLVRDLHFARSEAVKRNTSVAICAANPASTDCDNSVANWNSQGWLVAIVDASNVIVGQPIRIQKSFTSSDVLSDSSNAVPVRFNRFGMASNNLRSFTLCDNTKNNQYSRSISISRTGQIISQDMGTATCT